MMLFSNIFLSIIEEFAEIIMKSDLILDRICLKSFYEELVKLQYSIWSIDNLN